MKIINVSSEANPFVKVGGLGDVVYALSQKLAMMGEDVSIVLPMYGEMKNLVFEECKKIGSSSVYLAWRHQGFDIYRTYVNGITYYLVQNDYYFTHRPKVYGYFDDGERFAFFTLAAKALIEKLKLKPDIIHIHDWQVGMLPVVIREERPIKNNFKNTKFVVTIHNPAFQGRYGLPILGDLYNLSDDLYHDGRLRFYDSVSTLKAGIEYCDAITTVSPTHAVELLTSDGSWGLDGILQLKKDKFFGILNGIDTEEFNPREDSKIPFSYNTRTFLEQKTLNKLAFFKQYNLKATEKPFFVVVSRLTYQKGVDLIISAMKELLYRGYPCFVLGSGEWEFEQQLNELKAQYPDIMGTYIGYNDTVAHQLYAAADFFLMPSLFEPCGIGQMIAERYATLPIVRHTGGLADSVVNYDGKNLEEANGYNFFDNNYEAFINTINWALENYHKRHKKVHIELMSNAINTNNSWKKSATKYLKLYSKITEK